MRAERWNDRLPRRFVIGALCVLTASACATSTAPTSHDAHVDAGPPDAGTLDGGEDASGAGGAIACPYVGPPILDPTVFGDCSPSCGGAHCLPDFLVPIEGRANLAACDGTYGAGFCVPDRAIESAGRYVPTRCAPIPGTSAEGRCLSDCLPGIAANVASLVVDVCAPGEHCVPCFDPITGVATGACTSVSCDAPSAPAYTFPTCCPSSGTDQGRCLPTASLPTSSQTGLQQLGCASDALCVPDEYVPGTGVGVATCGTPGSPSTCVSRCLAGVPVALPQGSCPANHACLPCRLAPTGTPGCP